ncbi:hypothetical protein [Clostridium kluyveri]|uniref:Uncharacterized protein n=2 Tax=Clostridium kluyveri TaxID=1534 RepID=A5N0G4_CLOK5|nr:hypothetical protein [Clostridium kluyveri]EDK34610.1 Hypothetical protein CKL_2598 [Clostridium kluyveri DSM 555]BAH07355.1 hypothetical protein CKR_2304 [Clostridium kluyveri NBRC 12016]
MKNKSVSLSFSLSSSEASWVMVGYSIIMAVGAGTYIAENQNFQLYKTKTNLFYTNLFIFSFFHSLRLCIRCGINLNRLSQVLFSFSLADTMSYFFLFWAFSAFY